MGAKMTLYDVARYHLLRAKQAGQMAQALEQFEILESSAYGWVCLFHWIEAKTEADEIWNSKGYQEAMMQAWGIFDNA